MSVHEAAPTRPEALRRRTSRAEAQIDLPNRLSSSSRSRYVRVELRICPSPVCFVCFGCGYVRKSTQKLNFGTNWGLRGCDGARASLPPRGAPGRPPAAPAAPVGPRTRRQNDRKGVGISPRAPRAATARADRHPLGNLGPRGGPGGQWVRLDDRGRARSCRYSVSFRDNPGMHFPILKFEHTPCVLVTVGIIHVWTFYLQPWAASRAVVGPPGVVVTTPGTSRAAGRLLLVRVLSPGTCGALRGNQRSRTSTWSRSEES